MTLAKRCEGSACADVHIVPFASDNYGYILVDKKTKDAALVDAVDVDKFISALQTLSVNLKAILTTHHHMDHSGGNEKWRRERPEVPIYGSAYEHTPGATVEVKDNEVLSLGELKIECIHVPTHTKGHIAYLVKGSAGDPVVFTGDFLFLGGCGRFFEGTGETMVPSVEKFLAKCPKESWMFPGHEYSMSNLKFAISVEGGNKENDRKLKQLEADGIPTIPSQIAEELEYNVFIRAVTGSLQLSPEASAMSASKTKAMQYLRDQKDRF